MTVTNDRCDEDDDSDDKDDDCGDDGDDCMWWWWIELHDKQISYVISIFLWQNTYQINITKPILMDLRSHLITEYVYYIYLLNRACFAFKYIKKTSLNLNPPIYGVIDYIILKFLICKQCFSTELIFRFRICIRLHKNWQALLPLQLTFMSQNQRRINGVSVKIASERSWRPSMGLTCAKVASTSHTQTSTSTHDSQMDIHVDGIIINTSWCFAYTK